MACDPRLVGHHSITFEMSHVAAPVSASIAGMVAAGKTSADWVATTDRATPLANAVQMPSTRAPLAMTRLTAAHHRLPARP